MGESEETYCRREQIGELEHAMLAAAEALDFERAAELRDQLLALTGAPSKFSKPQASRRPYKGRRKRRRRKQPWE